jgi:hypothetical protein
MKLTAEIVGKWISDPTQYDCRQALQRDEWIQLCTLALSALRFRPEETGDLRKR